MLYHVGNPQNVVTHFVIANLPVTSSNPLTGLEIKVNTIDLRCSSDNGTIRLVIISD